MVNYHGKKEAHLNTFFRQKTKPDCAERNKLLQCIICGEAARTPLKIALHMKAAHSRLQLMKFNVHWICEWFNVFESVKDVCPVSEQPISMLKMAEHSSKCKQCSVFDTLGCVIQKCVDSFDNWDEKAKNLEAIREATELLHGLEKLTRHKKWVYIH